LRAEAEAVADAARERLRERDSTSRLAQSIKIIELEAGDHPAFAVGTDEPAGVLPRVWHGPKARISPACASFARSFTGR
jgi:hypothetical protein